MAALRSPSREQLRASQVALSIRYAKWDACQSMAKILTGLEHNLEHEKKGPQAKREEERGLSPSTPPPHCSPHCPR